MQCKKANLEDLTSLLLAIETKASLEEPSGLQERIEVLDQLEAYLLPLSLPELDPGCPDATVYKRARAIQTKLEAANYDVYSSLRRDVRRGRGRESLLRCLPDSGQLNALLLDHEGYDYLDEVIIGVLQFEEPEATTVPPTGEMVLYQPTPARHILDLLERIALTKEDVLVDIGSGLGHVSMLASIWTNARSIGIELEPAYVACARKAAESLNLKRVTFIQQDAQAADYRSGTVFYLYTPFTGSMLRTTLDLLRQEAATRTIRICTFGPCASVIAAEAWLNALGAARSDRISIFRSNCPLPSFR
jgi:hypothetical protein